MFITHRFMFWMSFKAIIKCLACTNLSRSISMFKMLQHVLTFTSDNIIANGSPWLPIWVCRISYPHPHFNKTLIYYIAQGCTILWEIIASKFYVPVWWQQFPYWRSANIRCCGTKFSNHGHLALGICLPWLSIILVQKVTLMRNLGSGAVGCDTVDFTSWAPKHQTEWHYIPDDCRHSNFCHENRASFPIIEHVDPVE